MMDIFACLVFMVVVAMIAGFVCMDVRFLK